MRAPRAARAFHPGQFYRLQNYESYAPKTDGTSLTMEGLALTGATVDREKGLLSTIVLEMGGSSDLCSILEPGEPVVLMGPTGTPTETPGGENVVLVGGGLGNAVLLSIGTTLRERRLEGALFRRLQEAARPLQGERDRGRAPIASSGAAIPRRASRRAGRRTKLSSAISSRRCSLMPPASSARSRSRSPSADRLIVIGSDGMMNAVARARETSLKPHLKPGHHAIASINSPMQCMMKEICAQCLQVQRDPVTGEETVVFSCFNQDQALDRVDFAGLRQRLTQNSLEEKLTALWIDRCLKQLGMREAAE